MGRTNKKRDEEQRTIGSGVRTARINGQQSSSSNYGDILNNLAGDGNEFEKLLNSFGISSDGKITGSDRKDWNKQLLDSLLNYYATQENREYNEGLRDDQRLYDNPMNQLARLIGAGISRDKAIELLGSGSGSGGSGVPYSQPFDVAEGIPPSETDLNHANAQAAKIQSGLGFVNAVSGLVSLGFSAAQAVPQVQMLANQAYLSKRQKEAFNDASEAFNIIAGAGVDITPDTFGSVDAVSNTLKSLLDSGNEAASVFMRNGGIKRLRTNSPYSLPIMNQLYKNEKEPDYYTKQIDSQLRQSAAQSQLAEFSSEKVLSEIEQVAALIENLDADTDYKEGLTSLLSWHANLLSAQTQEHLASANHIRLSNNVESNFQNTDYEGKSGLELLTSYRLNEMYLGLQKITSQIGSKTWEKEINTFLAEQDNLQATYALGTLYKQGQLDALENSTPIFLNHLHLVHAAQDCGLLDYINTKANVGRSGGQMHVNLGLFKGDFNLNGKGNFDLFRTEFNAFDGTLKQNAKRTKNRK